MNYEEMFVGMVSFMFVFNLLIQFFVVAMPLTAGAVLPASYVNFTYDKGNIAADMNTFTSGDENAIASSSIDTGSFTWNFGNLGAAYNVGMKMLNRVFFGYYELGIAIADQIGEVKSGPIHGLLGGIGSLFSIMSIFGMLLLLRSLVFKT